MSLPKLYPKTEAKARDLPAVELPLTLPDTCWRPWQGLLMLLLTEVHVSLPPQMASIRLSFLEKSNFWYCAVLWTEWGIFTGGNLGIYRLSKNRVGDEMSGATKDVEKWLCKAAGWGGGVMERFLQAGRQKTLKMHHFCEPGSSVRTCGDEKLMSMADCQQILWSQNIDVLY